MTGLPTGGGVHDLKALAQHFYYEAKREGKDTRLPLAFVGVASVLIGAKILYDLAKVEQKKDARLRSWVERCERPERGQDHER